MSKDELASMQKDHEARQEWERQEKLIADLIASLLSLPHEARVKVMQRFCVECGSDKDCDCAMYDNDFTLGDDL